MKNVLRCYILQRGEIRAKEKKVTLFLDGIVSFLQTTFFSNAKELCLFISY